MNNRNFNDLLHIPTREERLAKFRKSITKWTLCPAKDNEIREMLLSHGFSSSEYERVGGNVIIADGRIVVVIKRDEELSKTLYVYDDPLNEQSFANLSAKLWANDEVKQDIERAMVLLEEEEQ